MWIKKAGRIVDEMVKERKEEPKDIEILEMDELFTFVKKSLEEARKQEDSRILILKFGLLRIGSRFKTIAFKIGDGNKSNCIELALEIEKKAAQ